MNARLPGYDWRESYDWNYDNVPEPVALEQLEVPGKWDYCGLPIDSPLGMAAGPLLNGRWILYYASLGFDVLTYKTVRSRERASYPLPNLQPVRRDVLQDDGQTLEAVPEMKAGWAVSFGMPSRAPEIWRADIERTRRELPPRKVLSVSVVATPQPDSTLDELAADFALCARWATESGADCIEANFSCPNVSSADGQLFQQPPIAGRVAAQIREAIGARPLLIKVGYIKERALAVALVEALSPYVDALVMVNCIPARLVDADRRPLFDGQARGIAGPAIYDASLAQVRLFQEIIRAKGLGLRLVGVGGIGTAAQVREHLSAGSHAVQVATAAMLEPTIGLQIRAAIGTV